MEDTLRLRKPTSWGEPAETAETGDARPLTPLALQRLASARPFAVVLGLNPNGLGIVKSLVPHGIPVLAIDKLPGGWGDTHRWMSSRTRLCEKLFLPRESYSKRLIETLVELAPSFREPPVLFPSGDAELIFLSEALDRISGRYRLAVPTPEVLDLFVRKVGFEEYCRDHGVLLPASVWGIAPGTVTDVGGGALRFPCAVKPQFRDHRWDARFPNRKSLPAHNVEELREAVAMAEKTGAPLVIQEVIPGPDSLLHFSHVYLDSKSGVLQGWTGKKIRQLPIHFGTSTLAETTDDDEVMDLTLRLLGPVRYHGYGNVEFKRDLRDGTLRVMEVTVGRTWYPHFLGVAAGVNIPLAWYRDLVGLPQDAKARAQVPVRWIDEYRDLQAAVDYWRAGELSLPCWLASFRRVRGFALFSLRDPIPGFFVLMRIHLSMWNAAGRVLRRLLPRSGEAHEHT